MIRLALALCLLATPAWAQSVCGLRADIVARLGTKYAELQRGVGMDGNGRLIELFVAEEERSFTLIVSDPMGTSCVIAVGQAWQFVQPAKPELPSQ